jgi:Family of unknown function (DUF6551)
MSMVDVERSLIRPRKQKKPRIFERLNEHVKTEYRYILKSSLIVPVSEYQRDETTGRIATDIAMHYDDVAFQSLCVIQRANGELVVADGGTRLAGAMQRDDITTVPCQVFSGLTAKQEADVFLRINMNRRRLRTEQQHHAELYSGDAGAIKAQEFMDMLSSARIAWQGTRAMRTLVKRDFQATATVIKILLQVAVDKHVTARVMQGLVRLESILAKQGSTLDRAPVIKKMQARFGQFDAVVMVTVEPRQRGDKNVFARALARTLNIKFPRS